MYLGFVLLQQRSDAVQQIPQEPVPQALQGSLQLYQDWHHTLNQMLFHHG